MCKRVEYLRARAADVRHLAEWATNPAIRRQILAISAQYDRLADAMEAAESKSYRRAPIYVVSGDPDEAPERDRNAA